MRNGVWGIFVYVFSAVSWPSFNLIYPLCVSIWAMKSESDNRNRQCLTYWVLFALITLLELVLAGILEWFTYWPYAKGTLTLLLLMPYFGASSYIYNGFVRPYIAVHILEIVFSPTKKDNASDDNNILDGSKDLFHIGQADFWPNTDDYGERYDSCPSDQTIRTNVQKEWSCALCLVSTTSNKCLNNHLRGKRHKINEEELNKIVLSKKRELKKVKSSSMLYKPNGMVLLQNWSDFLAPVTTAIRWCRWERPEFGWTKLNTDGSICKKLSSFAGLLRDQNGDPICAYVSKAQSSDIFMVELWAIWRGLVLARSLNFKFIWVESDSLSVVKTINREQAYSSKGADCLEHIWQLLMKFEMYQVSHAWRETNKAADHLAKMDCDESDVVIWPVNFPISLCNIIKNDAQGRWFRRR